MSSTFSSHGGIEETLRLLFTRLDTDEFRFGLCSITDAPQNIITVFHELDIERFCMKRTGYFFDAATTLRIYNIMKRFKADIVHTHRNKANLHARIAGYLAPKISIVTTHHDMEDIVFSKNPGLKRHKEFSPFDVHDVDHPDWITSILYPFLNVMLNRLNSKVISVSNSVRDIYTAHPGDRRFETVYAPYDETVYHYTCRRRKADGITLGTVGRLAKPKGHLYLLQAMKMLARYHGNIVLKIIGDGPIRSQIVSYIKNHRLSSQVRLCGELPHNAHLYDGIDIYIQPSVSEGCCIAVLEAMALGIPVIASNIDGLKELILPEKSGILVPAKNPDALTRAITDLIDNEEKALLLGKAASLQAKEKFSAATFASKMADIYRGFALDRR